MEFASRISLSVVVPVFNEKGNLPRLHEELTGVLDAEGELGSYEIVYVDDGSTDGSQAVLRALKSPHVTVVNRAVNGGLTRTLAQGVEAARHPVVASLDSDLQNDPADLPRLLAAFRDGADCVCGVRETRHDPWVKRLSSKVGNGVRRLFLGDRYRDSACTLRMFKKACARNVFTFDGAHRFFPVLVEHGGWDVREVVVRHRPRFSGQSHYGVRNRFFAGLTTLIHVRRLLKQERKAVKAGV